MVGTIAFLMRTDMKANIKQLKSNFSYMRTFVEEEAAKVRAERPSRADAPPARTRLPWVASRTRTRPAR